MARFVALYRMPDEGDPQPFLQAYRGTHLPLVAATPGLTAVEVSRVRRTVAGQPQLLMAVMHFTDERFKEAMASAQWAAAGRNLADIGGLDLVTMFTLEEPEVSA